MRFAANDTGESGPNLVLRLRRLRLRKLSREVLDFKRQICKVIAGRDGDFVKVANFTRKIYKVTDSPDNKG
jgi:hypothetical protein